MIDMTHTFRRFVGPFMMAALGLLIATGCATTGSSTASETAAATAPQQDVDPRAHVVRVTVTSQPFDYIRPWRKKQPGTRQGIGVVLAGGDILVTARLVEDATYVELENMLESEKGPAEVAFVDYNANLALLRPTEPDVMRGLLPVAISPTVAVGDAATTWQFEDNGTPFLTEGTVRTIDLGGYPYGNMAYMVYNVEMSLTQGGSSFTIPVVKDGRLLGILMGYNSNTKIMQLVAAPVIQHFLDDKADGTYDGFPSGGFSVASLEDSQLRNYVGIGDMAFNGGVYVSYVRPGSAAAKAGLTKGDVLVSVGGFPIDKHGEFDDAEYGKMSLSFLTTTRSHVGQSLPLQVLRDGQPVEITMVLEREVLDSYPVLPYEFDVQPEYIIVGGMIFQELNRQMLQEWGSGYQTKAPNRLVYMEEHQWELFEPGQRQVLLTHTLPTAYTNGYTQFNFLPLTKANGKDIHSIHDLAAALKAPLDGFHKFEFQEQPYTMYMEAELVAPLNEAIQNLYKLPAMENLRH